MKITKIFKFEPSAQKLKLPLYVTPVKAGFPSPADDFVDHKLDLNEYLIKHPAATFFVKVAGDSMKNAGIFSGDILIVDRSLEPSNGKVVVAILNGEFTVKHFKKIKNQIILASANPQYPDIPIIQGVDFEIWGVVTSVIHRV